MRRTTIVLLAVSGLVLAGCGGDDDPDAGATTGTVAPADPTGQVTDDATDDATEAPDGDDGGDAGTAQITIQGFAFSGDLTVQPGQEITVTNNDAMAHTLTADDGAFDTGLIGPDESVTFTAPDEAGDYGFHCEPHPQMTNTLTVEG